MVNNFFEQKMVQLDLFQSSVEKDTVNQYYNSLNGSLEGAEVEKRGNTINVYQQDTQDGVIDMKPFFRRSPKANRKEKGGWYMVIPVRRYASRKRKDSSSGMSNRLYNSIRKADNGNVVSDYLYDNRTSHSAVPELNYTPKSNNITKKNNPRGRGSIYISFRTVSDKSPANSWLLNRDQADPNDLTSEVERIINEVRMFKQR